MLDVSADQGWLVTALQVIHVIQMVLQGRWYHDNTLLTLPHLQTYHLYCFSRTGESGGAKRKGMPSMKTAIDCLPQLMHAVANSSGALRAMLGDELPPLLIDQVHQALLQLPMIEVRMSIQGWWEGGAGKQETKPVPMDRHGGRRAESSWLKVHADQEYVLTVDLRRINTEKRRGTHAHTPRFPKPKDEGWFLLLGEIETKEVLALKRQSYIRGRSKATIAFYTPETTGRVIYTMYVMSDSYLGLDQQYDVCLDVMPASIEAQVNSEITDDFADLSFSEGD